MNILYLQTKEGNTEETKEETPQFIDESADKEEPKVLHYLPVTISEKDGSWSVSVRVLIFPNEYQC